MEKNTNSSHILVVDDEEITKTMLCQVVEHGGYQCMTASGSDEALHILANEIVDVVITDIRMSGLDGFELTEIVKKKYGADVIIITGYEEECGYEEAMDRGASDFALKPLRPKELLTRLRRVLRERALLAESRRMEERLRELTITDDLTKLYNSRHFLKQLQSEIDRTLRYSHPLSLLLIDVDNFKDFNDTYGHLEGDKVLAKLGGVIQGCLRKNDSGYRYGGDEFTVVLPETRGKEATTVAERIRKGFGAINFSPAPGVYANGTVSIGVAEYKPDEGLQGFARRADKAMYQAKREGGDKAQVV